MKLDMDWMKCGCSVVHGMCITCLGIAFEVTGPSMRVHILGAIAVTTLRYIHVGRRRDHAWVVVSGHLCCEGEALAWVLSYSWFPRRYSVAVA